MAKPKLKRGELAHLSTQRGYPSAVLKDFRPIKIEEEVLDLYILDCEQPLTRPQFATILGYHLSHFYNPAGNVMQSSPELVRSFIGFVTHLGDPSTILAGSGIKGHLADLHLSLDVNVINPEHAFRLGSHHFEFFKDLLGETWTTMMQDPNGILVMCGCVMLTMVKLLDPRNFSRWMVNRIRTMSGVLGNKSWINEWTENRFPDLDRLVALQSFMSANFHLRKVLFQVIYSVGRASTADPVSLLCREVVQLIRGAEMHHLVLIDEFLFNKYPELLHSKILSGTEEALMTARKKMEKYSREDLLFIKILEQKDNVAELNRQNFRIPAIVATTCARFENDTFDNYYIEESDKAILIADRVDEYLTYRMEALSIQAGAADVMSDEEKKVFFQKVLEDFETRTKDMKTTDDNVTPLRTVI